MGRKKRNNIGPNGSAQDVTSADTVYGHDVEQQVPESKRFKAPTPADTTSHSNNSNTNNNNNNNNNKDPTTETYLVKRYRPDKHYASMEAFVRYTKSHRMNDASYVRWPNGATADRPFVFATRVGGTVLGWGRGRTREAAMDSACRATFALVNAHGYKNFPLDEDCMLEAPPVDLPPPPPPPPPPLPPPPLPPPLGGYPLLPGMLPLPVGGVPPLPPYPAAGGLYALQPPIGTSAGLSIPPPPLPPASGFLPPPPYPPIHLPPPQPDMVLPQPKLPESKVPTPSITRIHQNSEDTSLMPTASVPTISLNLTSSSSSKPSSASTSTPSAQQLKGGLKLMYIHYNGDDSTPDKNECCAEEIRAKLERYQKMLVRAALKSSGK